MEHKVVDLCLIFLIYGINGGKTFTSVENPIVADALRRAGFLYTPNNVSDWQKAFDILAAQSFMNYSDCAIFKKNFTHWKQQATHWKQQATHWKQQATYWENEFVKIASVAVRRAHIEDAEEIFERDFPFTEMKTMLTHLKNNDTSFIGLNATEIKIMVKSFQNHVSEHTVKWLYYITFAEEDYANKLRKVLLDRQVPIVKFCQVVGKIYSLTIGKLHETRIGRLADFDLATLEGGLKYFGIKSGEIFDCLSIFPLLPSLSGFLPSMSSTTQPTVRPS